MCQSCCTHGSPHIQHQIATALAGVIDNPSATLSLPECRHALAHQQEAWDNYKPQFTMTSKCLVFLTSYRMVSTSSYTTLTSIIILAIAFHHSLSKVWMDHHPISTLYQNSFTVSLSPLLSVLRKMILLQSEFGVSFCGVTEIIGLQASQ